METSYVHPTPEIQGWMADDELQWLYQTAATMQTIVEVGCWLGRSTHALLCGCPGIVYAVDHWLGNPCERNTIHKAATERDLLPEFQANLRGFDRLTIIRKPSLDAAMEFADGSVDMVFIDGNHEYPACLDDMRAWWPKCRVILCGHDKGQDGVPQALQEFGKPIENAAGSIWSIRK